MKSLSIKNWKGLLLIVFLLGWSLTGCATGKWGFIDKDEKIGLLGGRSRPHIECLPVETRVHTFEEVDLGLSAAAAIQDAERCLRCYRIALLAVNE